MAPAPPTEPTNADDDSSMQSDIKSGSTAIDPQLAFDIEISAYAVADTICKKIAEELKALLPGTKTSHIFYLDNALREGLDLRPLVEMQLRNLQQSYRGAADSARLGLALFDAQEELASARPRAMEAFSALAAAPVVIDAAVGLLGLLREDRRYSGRTVAIAEHAFALTMARHIQNTRNIRFSYPTLFLPLGAGSPKILEELVRGMDAVVEQRKLASVLIERLSARVIPLDSNQPQYADARAALGGARDAFQGAEAIREEFQSNMTRADQKTGLSRVQLLERAGFVERTIQEAPGSAYFLLAQVVAAGGAFMTAAGLKADLTGDKLHHTAGVVATFALFRHDGTLVSSRTLGLRPEYESSDKEIAF